MRKFSIILVLLTVLTLAIYPTVKKLTENQQFELILANYKANEHGFIDRVNQHFRYVPKFRKNVEVKEVHRTDELQLFRIEELFMGVPSYGYFIYDKGDVSELKHQNVLLRKSQKLDLTQEQLFESYNLYELMVDLDQFNRAFNELSKRDQMDWYCKLFYSSNSEETFEKLTDPNQVDLILKDWPKSNGMPFEDSSILGDFDFLSSLGDNECALWTFDMGVNIFKFSFDETNSLTNCKIEFKGNLGNEIVHL